jgi:hypothetical protein
MKKRHTYLIALVLGLAAVLGAYASLHTAHLGAASRNAAAAQLARREHALNAAEARLRKALTQRPTTPVAAGTPPVAARQQKVVYVRPAPIVIHKHRAGGEHEQEGGGGESGD